MSKKDPPPKPPIKSQGSMTKKLAVKARKSYGDGPYSFDKRLPPGMTGPRKDTAKDKAGRTSSAASTLHRSTITGRFVSHKTAADHPSTTVKVTLGQGRERKKRK